MISYCGLDCSKCIGYIATQSGSREALCDVAKKWSQQFNADVKPEHAVCDGCKSNGRKSYHCENGCKIRVCCIKKGIDTCIECEVYPCKELSFVLDHAPEARKNLEQKKDQV